MEQAVKGQLLPVLEGIFLQLPIHTIWCRHPTESPAFLEILLNEAEEDQFLFRPDSSIRFPLSEAFLRSPSGYPILAPKIALLYKARHPEHEQNWRDAQVMLPEMPLEHRQWFWDALQWLEPRHTWLKEWGTLRTRN